MRTPITMAGLALATVLGMAAVQGADAGEALDRIMSSKVIRVATNSEYPPASSLNAQGEFEGYDIDVSKELAKRMGAQAEFLNPAWEAITSGKWGGRWEMSIGSMTPTPARAEVLNFPAVYYFTPAAFYVHADSSYKALGDLDGKTIAASGGSTYEQYLKHELVLDKEYSPPFEFQVTPGEIRSYETDTNGMDDLRLGDGKRVDGGLSSVPNIMEAIKAGYPIRILGEPVFYEPLAVATSRDDPELASKVAAIIGEMKADGTLAKLSEKWFGADLVTVKN